MSIEKYLDNWLDEVKRSFNLDGYILAPQIGVVNSLKEISKGKPYGVLDKIIDNQVVSLLHDAKGVNKYHIAKLIREEALRRTESDVKLNVNTEIIEPPVSIEEIAKSKMLQVADDLTGVKSNPKSLYIINNAKINIQYINSQEMAIHDLLKSYSYLLELMTNMFSTKNNKYRFSGVEKRITNLDSFMGNMDKYASEWLSIFNELHQIILTDE